MSVKVDKTVWENIKKDLRKGKDLELNVGFFPDQKYGPENDNLFVAQVAQFNEEGSDTNPPRPFMRVGFGGALKKGMYKSYFTDAINRIVSGESSFLKEYTKLGPIFVADMKEIIEEWDTPSNSPKTIEAKGFNDPLVWTGTMHDAVDFRVEKE